MSQNYSFMQKIILIYSDINNVQKIFMEFFFEHQKQAFLVYQEKLIQYKNFNLRRSNTGKTHTHTLGKYL